MYLTRSRCGVARKVKKNCALYGKLWLIRQDEKESPSPIAVLAFIGHGDNAALVVLSSAFQVIFVPKGRGPE
jgi:hypothetical protein